MCKKLKLPFSTQPLFMYGPQPTNDRTTATKQRGGKCESSAASLSSKQSNSKNMAIGETRSGRSMKLNPCHSQKMESIHRGRTTNQNKLIDAGSVRKLSKRRGRPRIEHNCKLLTGVQSGHVGGDSDNTRHASARGRPRKLKISVCNHSGQAEQSHLTKDCLSFSEQHAKMSSCVADVVDAGSRLSTLNDRYDHVKSKYVVQDDGKQGEQSASVLDVGMLSSSLPLNEPRSISRSIWNILPSLCADTSLPWRRSAESSTFGGDSSMSCSMKSTLVTSSSLLSSSSVSPSCCKKVSSLSSVTSSLPIKSKRPLFESFVEGARRDDVFGLTPELSSTSKNKLRCQSVSVVFPNRLAVEDRKYRDGNNNSHGVTVEVAHFSKTTVEKILEDELDRVSEVDSQRENSMDTGALCPTPTTHRTHEATRPRSQEFVAKLQLCSETAPYSVSGVVLNAPDSAKTNVTKSECDVRDVDSTSPDPALDMKYTVNEGFPFSLSDASTQSYQRASDNHKHKSVNIHTDKLERRLQLCPPRPAAPLWRPTLEEQRPMTAVILQSPPEISLSASNENVTKSGTARHRNLPPMIVASSNLPSCLRHNSRNIGRLNSLKYSDI